jgi:hypothetical protein
MLLTSFSRTVTVLQCRLLDTGKFSTAVTEVKFTQSIVTGDSKFDSMIASDGGAGRVRVNFNPMLANDGATIALCCRSSSTQTFHTLYALFTRFRS